MKTVRALRAGAVLAFSVIALVLASCANPATTTNTPTQNTVSGVVTDSVTGAGISGATVVLGTHTATTDSSGKYTISLPAGTTSAGGDLAVSKGTAYGFALVQDASVTVPTSALNFRLLPSSMPTGVTITGKVTDANGAELQNVAQVMLEVVNSSGGASKTGQATYTTGTGYSLSSETTGSSCMVFATVTYTDTTPPTVFYLKNVDLSGVSATLNLPVPSSMTSVDVNTSYTTGDNEVQLSFVVPGYGTVPAVSFSPTTSPATISISDPDGYKLVWMQTNTVMNSSTGIGTIQAEILASQALATPVTLPDFTLSPPSTYDDVASGGSYSNGTLTFTASTDPSVTMHLVLLGPQLGLTGDTTGSPAGLMGALWLTGSSITLPSSIQSVISGGTNWDIASLAGSSTTLSSRDELAVLHAFIGGSSGSLFSVPAGELAVGIDSNSMQNQFIP